MDTLNQKVTAQRGRQPQMQSNTVFPTVSVHLFRRKSNYIDHKAEFHQNERIHWLFFFQQNKVPQCRVDVTVFRMQRGHGAHLDAASWLDGQQSVFSRLISTDMMNEERKERAWGSGIPEVGWRDLVIDHLLNCVKALPLVWDVERFKDVREGGVITADPADGSLQV